MQTNKYNKIFELIDKAGGPKLLDMKKLSFKERMNLNFNIWAFIFTIFYYLIVGLWKKGITYLAITILLIILIDYLIPSISHMLWLIPATIFSTRANIDLYTKHKLNQNEWI